MKKLLCGVLVLMLALSAFALADSVPSKTTADLVTVTVDGDFELRVVLSDDDDADDYADLIEVAEAEVAKLYELVSEADDTTAAIEEYFGDVVDASGEAVDLSDALSAETLNVYEFAPIVVTGYDISYGDTAVTFAFPTPYDEEEAVEVLIGLYDADEDAVAWTAFDGVGTGEDDAIQVTFTADILSAAQDGIALIAVVSVDEAL